MRLTEEQQRQIQRIVQAKLGNTVVVSVFGSRARRLPEAS